jgi:hypothetical protein
MIIRFARTLSVIVILLAAVALADDVSLPKHLELARTLVSSLAPGDTSYRHKGWVSWKGDFLVSHNEAHTDCSGLITSLLERAESPSTNRLLSASFGLPPKARDYYDLIYRQDGFKRIDFLSEVKPGDIIAVKYLPGHFPPVDPGSGHVMLVDTRPILRETDTRPIVAGTRQWEVAIIDSSKSPHGKTDTRYQEDGSKRDGVGRGIVRLYSGEKDRLVGFSRSTAGSSNYYDNSTRPIVVGRPISRNP